MESGGAAGRGEESTGIGDRPENLFQERCESSYMSAPDGGPHFVPFARKKDPKLTISSNVNSQILEGLAEYVL